MNEMLDVSKQIHNLNERSQMYEANKDNGKLAIIFLLNVVKYEVHHFWNSRFNSWKQNPMENRKEFRLGSKTANNNQQTDEADIDHRFSYGLIY